MNKFYGIIFIGKYLKKSVIFSFMMFLFTPILIAQKPIVLSQNEEKFDLGFAQIEVFEDPSKQLTFDDILLKKFSPSTQKSINSGYSDSKFWYRIQVKNESSKRWIYVILGTIIDEIELFEILTDGSVRKRVSGDHYPQSSREIDSPFFSFYLDIPQNQIETLYLSIKSKDPKQFTLHIDDTEYFNSSLYREMFKWFFYFGMLFMMFVYNLLLYFSVRDKAYLYYVLYIANFGLFQFAIFGYGTQFIWGENIWFANRATSFFAGGTTIFISLFTYEFLNIKFFYPKLKFVVIYLIFSGLYMILINITPPTSYSNSIIGDISLFNILVIICLGILILLKGYPPARYYMIAWGALFLTLFVFILNVSKILPDNDLTYHILPLGGIIEVTMLSFGLGSKINTIEKEKTNAQKEVVKQLRTNEEVRSRIARDLHDDLGSTLSSIRILSELAENQTETDTGKLPNLLHRIKNSSQKLQENLQDIVWTTQSKDDSIEQLLVKMRLFGGEILEAKDIDYFFKIHENIHKITLPPNAQYDVFMIFKESINNVLKYAKAKNVWVTFIQDQNCLCLKIKDDGIGFDISKENEGNGLKNMPRRAENINGKVEICSKINEGTEVTLTIGVPI